MHTPDQYLTLPEIARVLRRPYRDVYNLLLTGKLNGDKIGGSWHIDPESFERYCAQQGNRA